MYRNIACFLLTFRIQRPNSKQLLRETNFTGRCPSYTLGNTLPPFPPSLRVEATRQRVDAESSPTEWSRGHRPPPPPPMDEWTDYTDGQWNLLLLEQTTTTTNEDNCCSLSTDRYAEPLLLSPEVVDRTPPPRHLVSAGGCRVRRVAPPGVRDLRLTSSSSFPEKESDEADDDTSENLIDFDTDEQTLVKRSI